MPEIFLEAFLCSQCDAWATFSGIFVCSLDACQWCLLLWSHVHVIRIELQMGQNDLRFSVATWWTFPFLPSALLCVTVVMSTACLCLFIFFLKKQTPPSSKANKVFLGLLRCVLHVSGSMHVSQILESCPHRFCISKTYSPFSTLC